MDWLNGISITCFAASYLVVLALEVSRVMFKTPLRKLGVAIFTTAGIFAHAVYLSLQTGLQIGGGGLWMGGWSGWCLSAAWAMMVAYLFFFMRQTRTPLGLFVIPIALVLIGLGTWTHTDSEFTARQAKSMWNMLHGAALLVGTITVALGFTFGIIYLIQARRLKQKKLPSKKFRFPSLEWLQNANEKSLFWSTGSLAIGLTCGFVVNAINGQFSESASQPLPWTDPVIITSGILFVWLLAVSVFSVFYQPARTGKKVAYLVVASFVFLMLELCIVLAVGHGSSKVETATTSTPVIVNTSVGEIS